MVNMFWDYVIGGISFLALGGLILWVTGLLDIFETWYGKVLAIIFGWLGCAFFYWLKNLTF